MEKCYIELKVVAEAVNKVFFKVKNTERKEKFNNGKQYFDASNGIVLHSLAYPSWDGKKRLFLLGADSRLDDMILIAFVDDFERIKQAVDEYNNKFALPEFVFRVSINKIGTSTETLLNKLAQNNKWKAMVFKDFKFFADEVVPAGSEYNIKYIQVNDKMLFTEVEYNNTIGHNKGMIHISAYIGDDDWTIYYNGCNKYKL